MNPINRTESDASAPQPKKQFNDLTVCISLASLFDFDSIGRVSQENWTKGMATLMLQDLGTDPKIWSKLVDMHGKRDGGKASLTVDSLKDVVPIDPRVSVLLNAIVKGLVGLNDFVRRSLRKEDKEFDSRRTRTIINMRKKILVPVFNAWKERMRHSAKLLRRSAHHAKYYMHFRAWRSWREAVEDYKLEAAEKRKRERQLQRVKAAALRMANAKVTAAWNSWIEEWETRKKFVRVCGTPSVFTIPTAPEDEAFLSFLYAQALSHPLCPTLARSLTHSLVCFVAVSMATLLCAHEHFSGCQASSKPTS